MNELNSFIVFRTSTMIKYLLFANYSVNFIFAISFWLFCWYVCLDKFNRNFKMLRNLGLLLKIRPKSGIEIICGLYRKIRSLFFFIYYCCCCWNSKRPQTLLCVRFLLVVVSCVFFWNLVLPSAYFIGIHTYTCIWLYFHSDWPPVTCPTRIFCTCFLFDSVIILKCLEVKTRAKFLN